MRRSLSLYAALLTAWFSPAFCHADFKMCNHTADAVFLMTVVPKSSCPSKQYHDLALLAPNACQTVYSGKAKNQVVYYDAWGQVDDVEWAGEYGIWVPYEPAKSCMPEISCHPSEGNVCGGGEVYSTRRLTVPSDSYTINLVN